MSKQLSISATFAVLSMAALALVTNFGGFSEAPQSHQAANTAIVDYDVSR